MTRVQLLQLLVGQARLNGFEFRRWYTLRLGLPWTTPSEAVACLAEHRRYYALLFCHEFASSFWKPGEPITFQVPAQTFSRVMPNGGVAIVHRKAFTRRSARQNAWRYHLREMAGAEDPLRYMRRYLRVSEDVEPLLEMPLAAVEERSTVAAWPMPRELHRSVSHGAGHAPGEIVSIAAR